MHLLPALFGIPVLLLLLVLPDQGDACGISMCGMQGGGCCMAPPMQNSCCGGGGGGGGCSRCYTKKRRVTTRMKREARHHVTTLNISEEEDPICNSEELRQLMDQAMAGEQAQSSEAIHSLLSEESPGHFAVVCSRKEFAYLADSKRYCMHTNLSTGETCYAFEH